jgi:hypothetical protein
MDGGKLPDMSAIMPITSQFINTANANHNMSFARQVPDVTAGSHSFCLAMNTNAGTWQADTGTTWGDWKFTVTEVRNAPGTGDVSSNGTNSFTGVNTFAEASNVCHVIRSTRTVNIPSTTTTQTSLGASIANSTITLAGWSSTTYPQFCARIHVDKSASGRFGCSPLIDGVLYDAKGVGAVNQPAWSFFNTTASETGYADGCFIIPVHLTAGSHTASLSCSTFTGGGTINFFGPGNQAANWFKFQETNCRE